MELRYNTPEVIEWMMPKKSDISYDDKVWTNNILESYDFMYILNLTPVHIKDKHVGTVVFFVTKEKNDEAQDLVQSGDYGGLDRLTRIQMTLLDSDKEKEDHPIIFNNIGTCIELKKLSPYVLPTLSLSEFYAEKCTAETKVKEDSRDWLFGEMAKEFYQLDTFYMTIKEDLSDMPLDFFETWEDIDSYQKYGCVQYAVAINGEIIGRISRSGRYLDTLTFDIFKEHKPLISHIMNNYVTVNHECYMFSDPVDNALSLFKHSDFNRKDYN